MSNSPRTAVCIFGQMRTYERCYEYLNNNIIAEHDPDIFIHTWKERGSTWKKDNTESSEIVTESSLDRLYSPESVVIERFREEYYEKMEDVKMPEKIKKLPTLQRAIIPMFYKMNAVNKLKLNKEKDMGSKYDMTILIRPDLAVFDEIPTVVINNLNVLWHNNGSYYRIDDQFLISSSENIDYLVSIWTDLNTLWETELYGAYGDLGIPKGYQLDNDDDIMHIGVPERLLHYHMKQSPTDTRSHRISNTIVRHDDDIVKPTVARQIRMLVYTTAQSMKNLIKMVIS